MERESVRLTRKIFIGIPAYSAQLHRRTAQALTQSRKEAEAQGWELHTAVREHDGILPRVRDILFSRFLASDWTDMLMVDADIAWQPGGFTRIMEHPVDVVGGGYPVRSDPEDYKVGPLENGTFIRDPAHGLMECEFVPTGFLRVTRAAAERLASAHADDWYRDDSEPSLERIYHLFGFELDKGIRRLRGEDNGFCRKWRAIGGRVWVDPDIWFQHVGEKVWTGCFMDYLLRVARDGPDCYENAVADIIDELKAMEAK